MQATALRDIQAGQIVSTKEVDLRPTIHVIGLPHTIANEDFSHCAFTGKLLRFADVAHVAGYRVVEYSNEGSESNADVHEAIFTKEDLRDYFGESRLYGETTSGPNGATHQDNENNDAFFAIVKRKLAQKIRPGDLVGHIMFPRADFVAKFNGNAHVETGIGYDNEPWGAYRIFESETWRAWHMGKWSATQGGGVGGDHGDPFPHYNALTTTAVCPNYYRRDDWATVEEIRTITDRRRCVFVGRMSSIKGIEVVNALANKFPSLDFEIISGEPRSNRLTAPNINWIGRVADRRTLSHSYATAAVTLIPSMFHEPFGGVCAEALLSGCPVIASNFGAFVEHVQEGDGYLASGYEEFATALSLILSEPAESLEIREARRARALERWSIEAVGLQYKAAFASIQRNWDRGILPERHPGKKEIK